MTSLLEAARNGDVDEVKRRIKAGDDVNTETLNGETPIYIATRRRYVQVVVTLLNAGANVNTGNEYGHTPLQIASEQGHVQLLQDFIAAKADVNQIDVKGQGALYSAAENGNKEVLEILLQNGADLHIKDNNGKTALMAAASKGHTIAMQLLLQYGADPNVLDVHGHNVLYWARQEGNSTGNLQLLDNYMVHSNGTTFAQTSITLTNTETPSKAVPIVGIVLSVVATVVIIVVVSIVIFLRLCKRQELGRRRLKRISRVKDRHTNPSGYEDISDHYEQIDSRPSSSIPQQYLTNMSPDNGSSVQLNDDSQDYISISQRTAVCYTPVDRHDVDSRGYSETVRHIIGLNPQNNNGDGYLQPVASSPTMAKPVFDQRQAKQLDKDLVAGEQTNGTGYVEPIKTVFPDSNRDSDVYIKPVTQGVSNKNSNYSQPSQDKLMHTLEAAGYTEPIHKYHESEDGYTKPLQAQVSASGIDKKYMTLKNFNGQTELHCEEGETDQDKGQGYLEPVSQVALEDDYSGYVSTGEKRYSGVNKIRLGGGDGVSIITKLEHSVIELGNTRDSEEPTKIKYTDQSKANPKDNSSCEVSVNDQFLEMDSHYQENCDVKNATSARSHLQGQNQEGKLAKTSPKILIRTQSKDETAKRESRDISPHHVPARAAVEIEHSKHSTRAAENKSKDREMHEASADRPDQTRSRWRAVDRSRSVRTVGQSDRINLSNGSVSSRKTLSRLRDGEVTRDEFPPLSFPTWRAYRYYSKKRAAQKALGHRMEKGSYSNDLPRKGDPF